MTPFHRILVFTNTEGIMQTQNIKIILGNCHVKKSDSLIILAVVIYFLFSLNVSNFAPSYWLFFLYATFKQFWWLAKIQFSQSMCVCLLKLIQCEGRTMCRKWEENWMRTTVIWLWMSNSHFTSHSISRFFGKRRGPGWISQASSKIFQKEKHAS